jgi:hypothetical protein
LQTEVAKQALEPTAEWTGTTWGTISVPPHMSMLFFQTSIYMSMLFFQTSIYMSMLFFQTSIYLRLSGITKLRVAVIAALVADLITSNPRSLLEHPVVATLWDNVTSREVGAHGVSSSRS